jgi:hypothetical protein
LAYKVKPKNNSEDFNFKPWCFDYGNPANGRQISCITSKTKDGLISGYRCIKLPLKLEFFKMDRVDFCNLILDLLHLGTGYYTTIPLKFLTPFF